MLEQKITIAILDVLSFFGVEPTDTICELTTEYVKAIIENM